MDGGLSVASRFAIIRKRLAQSARCAHRRDGPGSAKVAKELRQHYLTVDAFAASAKWCNEIVTRPRPDVMLRGRARSGGARPRGRAP